jgi:hypothetical protein
MHFGTLLHAAWVPDNTPVTRKACVPLFVHIEVGVYYEQL